MAAALDLSRLPRARKIELIELLEERERRKSRRSFFALFPDGDLTWDGPKTAVFQRGRGEHIYARHRYPKHLEHFAAGAKYRERCAMMANRVGKTIAGGYEDACHLTGLYPAWWEGRWFDRPTDGWAAGKTNETTRDILQKKLLGEVTWRGNEKTVTGTGIIPGDLIGDITWKQGVQDFIDTVRIKHVSASWSVLGFKSYQQGRGAFEGTEKDFIHLDEEPPKDIYGECLIRTATTNGLIYLTFTPLDGLSDVVRSFLPGDYSPGQT